MIRYVLPRLACDEAIDRRVSETVGAPDRALAHHTRGGKIANLSHLSRGEFRTGRRFADRIVAPIAHRHVDHVVHSRARIDVVRADTPAIVAMMEDKHSIRNGTVVQLVGEAVRRLSDSARVQHAVPVCADAATPFPASLGLHNASPEASDSRCLRACGRAAVLATAVDTLNREMRAAAFTPAVRSRGTRHESNLRHFPINRHYARRSA